MAKMRSLRSICVMVLLVGASVLLAVMAGSDCTKNYNDAVARCYSNYQSSLESCQDPSAEDLLGGNPDTGIGVQACEQAVLQTYNNCLAQARWVRDRCED